MSLKEFQDAVKKSAETAKNWQSSIDWAKRELRETEEAAKPHLEAAKQAESALQVYINSLPKGRLVELIRVAQDHSSLKAGIKVNEHIWYIGKINPYGSLFIEDTNVTKTRWWMGGVHAYSPTLLEIYFDQATQLYYIPDSLSFNNKWSKTPGFSYEEAVKMIDLAVAGKNLVSQ